MAERVGQSFGNYQLLRLLGRGAFAEVYLAEHRYLEIPAAIKVLHVRMEPDTHEQFLREARTIAHTASQRHTAASRADRTLCQTDRPRVRLCPPAARNPP